jgi:hypothetical protein
MLFVRKGTFERFEHLCVDIGYVCVSLLDACTPWQIFWLGSLRHGLCNGTAMQVFTDQITPCSLHCYVASLSYSEYNGEMLFSTVVLSTAC